MTLDPYHHEHTGVEEIRWSRLAHLLPKLAQKIRGDWQPEIVVGIAKGGVIPAAYLSSVFRLDFFPIKLSSRHNEEMPTSAISIDVISSANNLLNAKRSILSSLMKPHVFRSNRWIAKWRKLVDW